MPGRQGDHDGLCGMYSIANAYQICGYDRPEDEEGELKDIFRIACDALTKDRWPNVLWKGTSFKDMKKMIDKCLKETEWWKDYDGLSVKVEYPFSRNTPKTNDEYWDRLFDIFEGKGKDVRCAIVGMEAPSEHWIVVEPSRSRNLLFSDSTTGTIDRVRIEEIHAGKRKPSDKEYKFNRKELIVFSVKSVE